MDEDFRPPSRPQTRKESQTLAKQSLKQLAKGMGKDPDGLTFVMLINLPTTTIINVIYDNDDNGLMYDDSFAAQTAVIERCLMLWSDYTLNCRNLERVKILERALRHLGKNEVADALLDRFSTHAEIGPDMFA